MRYEQLLRSLQEGNTDIDFTELRFSFTEAADYGPYDEFTDYENEIELSLQANNYQRAIAFAKRILDKQNINIETHAGLEFIYGQINDLRASAFHGYIADKLLESIGNSGDGKSETTAFKVVRPTEEHIFIRSWGMKFIAQTLIKSKNNTWFDKLEVNSESSDKSIFLFFDITIPYRWLQRWLREKR